MAGGQVHLFAVSVRILGIDFRTDGPELPGRILEGGLVVVPSGPGMSGDLLASAVYRKALRDADWVIPDSGLMVLVWNLMHLFQPSLRLQRYSGLRLIRELLPRPEIQARGVTFWIMPSADDRARNLAWLQANGFADLSEDDCYLAPVYRAAEDGLIADEALLEVLERRRPAVIFLNVGGGVQEQLGWYLRTRLSYRPAIICTGAAIAFLSGGQVSIPPLADKLYLGWLLRTLADPAKFGPRYRNSLGLITLLLRYGARSPVAE